MPRTHATDTCHGIHATAALKYIHFDFNGKQPDVWEASKGRVYVPFKLMDRCVFVVNDE